MIVKNRTKYFNEFTRYYNQVPDVNSFSYESSRRDSYYQRLYWEYKYTESLHGATFFYTLTYNNKSIPCFLGKPCFKYEDIRVVTSGRLSKVLLRQYGARLRWFCACESGDGKGKRGFGNNPHYHFIFFVQPVHKDGKPVLDGFRCPDCFSFRKLVKEIWQGKEWIPFQKARFGIAQEGDFCGLVQNADAFSYVCKYVTKDAASVHLLMRVTEYYRNKALSNIYDFEHLYSFYKWQRDLSLQKLDKYQVFDELNLRSFLALRKNPPVIDCDLFEWHVRNLVGGSYWLFKYKEWLNDFYVEEYVSYHVSEFKNNYSGKVRCSKSLGEYGLCFVQDLENNPHFKIPKSDKFEVKPLALYYVRKLFYNVEVCPLTGNNLYVLNRRGIDLKVHQLYSKILKFSNTVDEFISCVRLNDVSLPDGFNRSSLNHFSPSVLFRYSVFSLVYRFRHYTRGSVLGIDVSFSLDCIESDYRVFLENSFYRIEPDDELVFALYLKQHGCYSFLEHPEFLPYKELFCQLDLLVDSVRAHFDDLRMEKYVSRSDHMKRIEALMHSLVAC